MMFSLRAMNPLKESKKASTAANKIRNKILNTSSFFKVSLQTNNRALALALEVQKERSRQLEKEVVLLQRQVETLCFQLASRNYKHRRLLMILKNLQRDTMEQLSSATDLLTSSEDSRISSGQHEASPAPGRIPESRGSIRISVMNVREQLVCEDQRCSEEVGPSRPSISLREEVERLSAALSQPVLVPQSREEACPPSASTNEAPPPQGSRPEKTVLLNSSMEMTVCSDGDIVTVETTARRRQEKNTQNETKTSSGSGPALSQTDQEENTESSAPKVRFMRAAPSRIPKLRPPEQRALPTADLDLDDYFKDPQRTSITGRKSRGRPRKTLVSSPDPDLLGPEDCPQLTRAVTCSRGSRKSHRRRGTFVVAVIGSSDRVPQEGSPSEEPPNARADTQGSGKRSWEASEEQFITPDLQVEVLTQNPAPGPQTQKQKRARREEPGRFTKTTKKKKGLTKDSNVEPSSHPNTNDTCGAPPPPPEGKQATPPLPDFGHTFSPPLRSRNLRDTFVFCQIPTPDQSEERCDFEMLMDEPPPWVGGASAVTPHAETQRWSQDKNLLAEEPQEEPGLLDRRTVEKKTKKKKGLAQDSNVGPSSHPDTNQTCGAPPPPPEDKQATPSESDVGHAFSPTLRSRNLRDTFVFYQSPTPDQSEERCDSKMLMDEPPPWVGGASAAHAELQEEPGLLDRRTVEKKTKKKKGTVKSTRDNTNRKDACGAPPPPPDHLHMTSSQPDASEELRAEKRAEPPRRRTKKKGLNKDSNMKPSSHPDTNQEEQLDTCGAPPPAEGKQATPPESDVHKPLCRRTFSPPPRSGTLRETFEFCQGLTPNQSEEGGVSTATPHREGGGVSTATPHREGGVSTATPHREGGVSMATPHREGGGVSTPRKETGSWRTTHHVVNASPGRVLTSLTNTLTTPEGEVGGRGRRRHAMVSYKEPMLNSKMRRGDKFTETTFLSSPKFKDAKKKKRQKKGAGLTAASTIEDCL